MYILVLNGPPRSGKDTLANYICRNSKIPFKHLKFATKLKAMTHRLYDVPKEIVPTLEQLKDMPTLFFLGLTPRQAYINVAECMIKAHGNQFFGEHLVKVIKQVSRENNIHHFVISDGGFEEELLPLIKSFGKDSIKIQKIIRKGCSFKNDSRHYLEYCPVEFLSTLINDDLNSFLSKGLERIQTKST